MRMRTANWGILILSLAAPSLAHAETTWTAGAGVRHLVRNLDDGLNTVDPVTNKDTSKTKERRWEYRGMVGASGKGDVWDWGMDIRTQPAGSVTTEWISNSNNTDMGIGLSQAYGRYHRNISDVDFAVTVGRAKPAMMFDNISQQLFDNDVRFDGFGWSFKYGQFGLNAAQYILGSVSKGTVSASSFSKTESSDSNPQTQSHFGVLYSIQPYVQFKIMDDINSLFAIGWYNWAGTGGNMDPTVATTQGTGFYTNNVHGGTAGVVGNIAPVIMDNAQQWQLLSDTSLPHDFRLLAEYVRNKKTYYGTRLAVASPVIDAARVAWAVSLAWGKPKKAGDLFFSYTYGNKGIASVINTFTNGDVSADNTSHFFAGRYYYADSLYFEAKAQFHTEKALLGGDGQPVPAPNGSRKQTNQRFEFVTNLQL